MTFKQRVAIPSNRVNVSYEVIKAKLVSPETEGRNPLKSGQCFLRVEDVEE